MPLLIHMTFRDKGGFSRHHALSLASWARLNPGHAILLYDDADLRAYLEAHLDGGGALADALETPVERADLWRYAVVCAHGGVYADADTLCVRPVQRWNAEGGHDAAAFFGVEDVFRRDPLGGGAGWGVARGRFGVQFEQWALAAAPRHPVFCDMPRLIGARVAAEARERERGGGGGPLGGRRRAHARTHAHTRAASATSGRGGGASGGGGGAWSILHRTGPHVFTDSVLRWAKAQGVGFHEALAPGGRGAGGARLMPGEAFGCAAHFFSNETRLDEVGELEGGGGRECSV